MTSFEFKWSWRLCLAPPVNRFNFGTQKFEKRTEKCRFKNYFLRGLLWRNFDLNSYGCLTSLSQKMVSTSSRKNCKKLKISFFKYSEHSFLISRSLQNRFLRSFLWSTLNSDDFEGSVSLSQKTVSTSSLKNLN